MKLLEIKIWVRDDVPFDDAVTHTFDRILDEIVLDEREAGSLNHPLVSYEFKIKEQEEK